MHHSCLLFSTFAAARSQLSKNSWAEGQSARKKKTPKKVANGLVAEVSKSYRKNTLETQQKWQKHVKTNDLQQEKPFEGP